MEAVALAFALRLGGQQAADIFGEKMRGDLAHTADAQEKRDYEPEHSFSSLAFSSSSSSSSFSNMRLIDW